MPMFNLMTKYSEMISCFEKMSQTKVLFCKNREYEGKKDNSHNIHLVNQNIYKMSWIK